MAEMVGSGSSGAKKGKGPKTKKKSTKIDMTAMVDVAFLLLTFFVLTATMTNQTMMKLTMPPKVKDEKDIEQDVKEEKVMTIVLCKNDTVRYYKGCLDPGCAETTIEIGKASEMREAIKKHLALHTGMCGMPGSPPFPDCWDPIFVVKARYNARYANLVDILDEFAITGAKKYAIAPEGFTEKDSIALFEYEAKPKTTP